jgi:hypothetical protein
MLPAQLLSVLHYPLCLPSSYPPFAKYAKDGAPAAVVASAFEGRATRPILLSKAQKLITAARTDPITSFCNGVVSVE